MSFMKDDLHPGFREGRMFLERFCLPPQAADEVEDDDDDDDKGEEAICCSMPACSGPAFVVWLT